MSLKSPSRQSSRQSSTSDRWSKTSSDSEASIFIAPGELQQTSVQLVI